jgi:hypothetical protein
VLIILVSLCVDFVFAAIIASFLSGNGVQTFAISLIAIWGAGVFLWIRGLVQKMTCFYLLEYKHKKHSAYTALKRVKFPLYMNYSQAAEEYFQNIAAHCESQEHAKSASFICGFFKGISIISPFSGMLIRSSFDSALAKYREEYEGFDDPDNTK